METGPVFDIDEPVIEGPQFTDAAEMWISVVYNGRPLTVPVDESNSVYRDLLRWVDPAAEPPRVVQPFTPHLPTIGDVRAEASRRMVLLLGAEDDAHKDILISNGTREAVKLLRIGAENWSPEEAERATYLEQIEAAIDAIRDDSNLLEAADPIPADFADDVHWPGGDV